MSNVKKAYTEIVALLEANKDKKVSSVLDQVIELASAKTNRAEGSTYVKDTQGNVVAILDYYFKRWLPLVGDKAVEFGKKDKTATGFNTMCKEGVSAWTKQQNEAKKALATLLNRVAAGEVKPADIAKEQEAIEATRKAINFPVGEDGKTIELGFADRDSLVKYLAKNKVEVAAE